MTIADLTRNAVDVLPEGGLEEKLKLGRPLRVKLGIDVTSPDIHIGRGDPAAADARLPGRGPHRRADHRRLHDADRRPVGPLGRAPDPLRRGDRRERADATSSRRWSILDPERTEVRYNGEWLSKLTLRRRRAARRARSPSRGCSSATTSRSGWRRSEPISVSELLYPLMQAYDSVAIEADVELGGTDQLYNLLAGREVMEHYGLEPQVVLTTPLLLSWDGEKMSSSVGNNIPLHGAARGDVRPHDADPGRAARRVVAARRRAAGARGRAARGEARARPLDRRALARGGGGARRPRSTSRASCARARRPEEVPEVAATRRRSGPPAGPARRRRSASLSTSEARRLIAQGGVKLDGEAVDRARPAAGAPGRRAAPGREAALRPVDDAA